MGLDLCTESGCRLQGSGAYVENGMLWQKKKKKRHFIIETTLMLLLLQGSNRVQVACGTGATSDGVLYTAAS